MNKKEKRKRKFIFFLFLVDDWDKGGGYIDSYPTFKKIIFKNILYKRFSKKRIQ